MPRAAGRREAAGRAADTLCRHRHPSPSRQDDGNPSAVFVDRTFRRRRRRGRCTRCLMADCKSKNSCRGRQHGMCDHCERELIMRRVRMTTSMHGARCACDRGTARSLCTLVRMLRGSAASPPEPAPLSGRQRVSTESAPDVTLTSVRLRFQPGSWVKIRRRDEGFWCEVVHTALAMSWKLKSQTT